MRLHRVSVSSGDHPNGLFCIERMHNIKKEDYDLRRDWGLLSVIALLFTLGGGTTARAGVGSDPGCTAEQGQLYIEQGDYEKAIKEFSCVIKAAPTEIEGYRGRAEAELLLGRFADAIADYTSVNAYVVPVRWDAASIIYKAYADRLKANPEDIKALTGASFARWWFFDYGSAMHLTNRLVEVKPDDLYGNLFRGSSRLLRGAQKVEGMANLEYAISLAPESPDVRLIVADAYTYGAPDPDRAFYEASLALEWGLSIPRVHAILAASYIAFGDLANAGIHIETHIDQVTTELIETAPLPAGESLSLDLVPGRTYDIPVSVNAGETLSIVTGSKDFWDTILVLLAPDGTPVLGADDTIAYYAAFDWVAETSGTYHVLVTSFEAVSTGVLNVTRN